MKKVLITGASGLIGQQIVKLCMKEGISVNFLTTNPSLVKKSPNYQGFFWDPSSEEIDKSCFEEVSVIINLAGSPIARRWTTKSKRDIIRSRTASIDLLIKTILENKIKIDHFISASAIGYYPFSEMNFYDEDHIPEEESFIISVVKSWEKAADKFDALDIPVSKIRIGLVLSDKGGVLQQLMKPIKWYLGALLGSGRQWQSWIHINDLANIFLFLMKKKRHGIFNAVAPNPVTHKVLIQQIAKVLKRPILWPKVPELFLRILLGKMHVLITKGQRVSSKKLESTGYKFEYYQLEVALKDLLL